MPDSDLKDALDIGPDTMGRTQIGRPITREEAVRIAQDARKRAERTRTEFAEKEAGMSEQAACPKCGDMMYDSDGCRHLVGSSCCLARQLAAMTQRAEGSEQAARDWKKVADEATGERDNLIRAIQGPEDELISVADALDQAQEQRFAFDKLCEVEAIEADRDRQRERAEKAENGCHVLQAVADTLEANRDRLRAIVDKLPKTAARRGKDLR